MTYGTNAPLGFQPVSLKSGAAWTGNTNAYPILSSGYATSIFRGDPVAQQSDGTMGIGVAGSAIRGVANGVKYIDTSGNVQWRSYYPANTAAATGTTIELEVIDDPNVMYTIQEANAAGTAGTPIALTDVNQNYNFHSGTGNTASGNSGFWLDNSTGGTTATNNLKLMWLDKSIGNVVGAYANWIVELNNAELNAGTGTVGV